MTALRVPVLVNDRPDIALAAGAAGVHLGPGRSAGRLSRAAIAPPGFVIGASVGSTPEAAAAAGADYWGIGPWRVTTTKADAGDGLGPRRLRAAGASGRRAAVPRDRGGPARGRWPDSPRRAASGVAVVSGILVAADVRAATEAYAWRGVRPTVVSESQPRQQPAS